MKKLKVKILKFYRLSEIDTEEETIQYYLDQEYFLHTVSIENSDYIKIYLIKEK